MNQAVMLCDIRSSYFFSPWTFIQFGETRLASFESLDKKEYNNIITKSFQVYHQHQQQHKSIQEQ
jgi:hypothetical protein